MAEGRFFDSSGAWPTLYSGAEPVAGAAGSAVLLPGLGLTAGPWAWVVAWVVGPWVHALV